MTAIFYPDLSHYDLGRGVTIEAGTVAACVKGTHGTAFLDSAYATYRSQATRVGAYVMAYHWLNHGNAAAQAECCWGNLGRVPLMVDAEDMPGNTGYTGALTVADIVGFVVELRRLGGVCQLVYLPHWYWADHMGSPDLGPLVKLGLSLVSSNYTTYSDTGPGWVAYGGMTPAVWQYTNARPYGGGHTDFNAYRGTIDQFRALTMGGPDMGIKDDRDAWIEAWRVEALTMGRETVFDGPMKGEPVAVVRSLNRLEAALRDLGEQVGGAATQDQVDAAMLRALQDPGVLAGLGAAIASHLHVT